MKKYNCQNCGVKHKGVYGSGRFCCLSCANVRPLTKEVKEKISKSMALWIKENPGKSKLFSKEVIEKRSRRRRKLVKKKLLESDFKTLSSRSKKNKLILEDNSCKICGLTKWRNKKITLHFDHIDGDRNNNKRNNLRLICPNCHSQTETYCGKNKKNKIKKNYSSKKIARVFKKQGNIRQTLLALDLSPKGSNYESVKRSLLEQGIKWRSDGA